MIFYTGIIGNKVLFKCTIDALDTWVKSLEQSGKDLSTLVITTERKGE